MSTKTGENDELLEKFKKADNGNEWFIAVNTVPVKREIIVDGFLDKLGITGENSFVYGLIKSIAPMLPDRFFDAIGERFFGGGANHTYISVCEMVDGKPVVRENLEAMGLEFKDGQPVLSGEGELIPVIKNDAMNPLYQAKLDSTTQTVKIIQGDKDTIYQNYSTMLDTANQVFNKSIKYDMSKENCNALTAESLQSIGAFSKDHKKLGVGMDTDTFKTNASQTNLKGDALMKQIEQQKQQLGSILEQKMSIIMPQSSSGPAKTFQNPGYR